MEIICGLGLLNKKTTIYKTGGTSTDKISYGETCPSSIETLTDGLFFLRLFFDTRIHFISNKEWKFRKYTEESSTTQNQEKGRGDEQLVWFSLELEKKCDPGFPGRSPQQTA